MAPLNTNSIERHDASDVHWRLVRLDIARRSVLANKKDLLHFLVDTGEPGTFALPLTNRDLPKLYDLTIEASRKLLNFTASTKQAIDHSRRTASNLCRSDARSAQVERSVDRLKSTPEFAFMTELRNLMQHETIPPIHVVAYYENRPARIRLSRDSLLRARNLPKPVRRFIADHQGDFGIVDVTRRYSAAVVELVEAVIDQIASENEAALRRLYVESTRAGKDDLSKGTAQSSPLLHRFVSAG